VNIDNLQICPMTIKGAKAFIAQHHRHHKPPQGGLFAVGISKGDRVVGVCVVGRPVARMLQDGWTAEVTRLATDGSKNACSMLYQSAWRAARAIGYRKLITYILNSEPGTSLKASGWKCIGECGGGKWSRTNRPRVDDHPTQTKIKWERAA
jgi:hypothetical protein